MTTATTFDPPAVFRFAPSPNGALHLGHALSALTTYSMAKRLNGRFLVRIEDIDTVRCRQEHIDNCLADLAWLGLTWEEPVLRQSEHFKDYAAAAGRLHDRGLLYPCFATRQEIADAKIPDAVDPDGAPIYPGLHKSMTPDEARARIAAGQPYALRLDMTAAMREAQRRLGSTDLTFQEIDETGTTKTHLCKPDRWGDTIVIRKDTPASYHLAVVVDDARQGITHVTRGMDLFAATDLHRLLQVLLEFPAPLYHHHRLITGVDGRKLAKSAGDTSLAHLRQQGITPAQIYDMVGLPRPA